jgi:N-acetylneuraminic acid mutarotase
LSRNLDKNLGCLVKKPLQKRFYGIGTTELPIMHSNTKTKTSITLLLTLSLVLLALHVPLVYATEDSWESKAPMQQARSGLGVATVNGKIYAIGGSNASGFAPSIGGFAVLGNRDIGGHLGTNEEYDPETDTWTYKASMPTPRIVFATAVYQNKIYCIGGKTSDGYTGVNEVYDPVTDTWETKTAMPTARGWLTANVVGGKIYLISGYPNETLNEVYDPATDTWITKSSPETASPWGITSAVFDNKIYVIGSSHLQIYETEADTWSYGTSPPSSAGSAGSAAATTGVLAPEQIYVIGVPLVLSPGAPIYSNQAYDPEEDNWAAAADLPTRRFNFGVAVLNDIFYVIGGHTYDQPGFFAPSAANEQYTPIGYIPEFLSWIILPLFIIATVFVIVSKKKLFHSSS